MNWLDLVVVLLLIAGVVRGIRRGGVLQVFPFLGFVSGMWLGAALAPSVSRLFPSPLGKPLSSLATVFVCALVASALGQWIGLSIRGVIHRAQLAPLDYAAGAAISVVLTLVSIWLIAAMFATLPSNEMSAAFSKSRLVRSLVGVMPPAPSVFSRIRALIDETGFPEVFAGLEPPPAERVEAPSSPDVRAAVAAAGASVVKVTGLGCGGVKTGSGFVGERGLVVTNAHVISGTRRISVEDRRGTHRASPVLFDPKLDLAILRTSGLGGRPLDLLSRTASRGTGGAVLGYPEGGPFRANSGAVLRSFVAVGRDIYGDELTRRQVYQLQASVRPGNSGGPFVEPDGDVIGVIFSASVTEPDVSYALLSKDVISRLADAAKRTDTVSTQEC